MSDVIRNAEIKCDVLEALQRQGMARKEKHSVSPGERVDRVLFELNRMGWTIVRQGERDE